nr:transposase [Serratia proteamaculans]
MSQFRGSGGMHCVRLSLLCDGHINILYHSSLTLAELVTKGHPRPLKEASEEENIA